MPSNPPPSDPAGTDNNRPLRTPATNTQRRRRAAGRIMVGILFPELHPEMFGHPLYQLPRTVNRTSSRGNGTNDPDRSTTVPFSGLAPQNLRHRPQIPPLTEDFSGSAGLLLRRVARTQRMARANGVGQYARRYGNATEPRGRLGAEDSRGNGGDGTQVRRRRQGTRGRTLRAPANTRANSRGTSPVRDGFLGDGYLAATVGVELQGHGGRQWRLDGWTQTDREEWMGSGVMWPEDSEEEVGE